MHVSLDPHAVPFSHSLENVQGSPSFLMGSHVANPQASPETQSLSEVHFPPMFAFASHFPQSAPSGVSHRPLLH